MSRPPEGPKNVAADVLAEARFASLLRPELSELRAYVPQIPDGIEVKLDANEAPETVSPHVRAAIAKEIEGVSLQAYPDPCASRLKAAIAKRTGAEPDEILVGSGSDDVITTILTALARPQAKHPQAVVLTPTPTFGMYRTFSRARGLFPLEVPLDSAWDLDVRSMSRAIEMMQPSIVIVASPNNPTGNRMSDDRLSAVLEAARDSVVVIDEAYVDFAGSSVRRWREEHRHLGILRTLSKIGLAALRVGWLEADAALVAELDKVRAPYNVSATSQVAASAVLEDAWDDVQAGVARIVRARDELARAIGAIEGFVVTPSDANFLWVKTPTPAEEVFAALVRDRILVRSFHPVGGRLLSQVRITIGGDDDNARVVEALRRFRGSRA